MINKEQLDLLKEYGYSVDEETYFITDCKNVIPYASPYYDMINDVFRIRLNPIYVPPNRLKELKSFINKRIMLVESLNFLRNKEQV